jgi:AraC-like DNA-binding protein
LEFDSRLLGSPNIRTEKDLEELLAEGPRQLLVLLDYESSVGEQVRHLLGAGLHGQQLTADQVAARLSISPQHLRRRLHDEQTSFTQIREEVLRDAAVASLTSGSESTADLSRRLGFSEESAFRRAFRRWTGSPPGAYRKGDRSD